MSTVRLVRADLDGDGTLDDVDFMSPSGECPGGLTSSVPGLQHAPSLEWTTPPTPADTHVVDVPGRSGHLVLLLEQHPRGGFQTHVFGYADGKLEELTVDGDPVFPFVATDVQTTPLSARCTEGGFEVLAARAHQPVGIMPAWDIDRTTYTVDGNRLTQGPTTEVADNVLQQNLERRYRDLVAHELFANCRVPG